MREEVYDISGMHCAACSASVEKVTRKLPGVERSDVNLVAERMTIVYDEHAGDAGADYRQGGKGGLRRKTPSGAAGIRSGTGCPGRGGAGAAA